MAAEPVFNDGDYQYSALELSAIQEVANIGTGNAATALAQITGRSVDISVPQAELVSLADAAERIGPLESEVVGVLTPLVGTMAASVLLAFPISSAGTLCAMVGVDADSEMALSAIQEIGNILTGSYATAIATMTGIPLQPLPPVVARDMLGSIVDAVLAMAVAASDRVLFLQTDITIAGVDCTFGFLLVPEVDAISELLRSLGLA
jgi:chemotaxis protein CheC